MQLNLTYPKSVINQDVNSLLNRALSPFTGILQEIGIISRERNEPKVIVTGGELTGVHTLLNRPHPGRNGYHVGGTDYHWEKAAIKTVAEAIERYSQLLAYTSNNYETCFSNFNEMKINNRTTIDLKYLTLFNNEQFNQKDFPFEPYDTNKPLTWVKCPSSIKGKLLWVPAQFLFVGYNVRVEDGEPWLNTAVTTGTATHVEHDKAQENALLELLQLDSVMGHWYGKSDIYAIELDQRTAKLERFLKTKIELKQELLFYYLPNPDIDVFTIACFIKPKEGVVPKVAIGLGADMTLESAMYKAFLEAIGVNNLAKILLFRNKTNSLGYSLDSKTEFYDLDSNVAYYANNNDFHVIEDRFLQSKTIKASKLPQDFSTTDSKQRVKHILNQFRTKNIDYIMLDITTKEATNMGFVVPRFWSPDLLSLCLPSAPLLNHPRFKAYGGVCHHVAPHPYP